MLKYGMKVRVRSAVNMLNLPKDIKFLDGVIVDEGPVLGVKFPGYPLPYYFSDFELIHIED